MKQPVVAEEVATKNHSREMAEIMIVTGQTMVVEGEGMDTEQGAVLEDIKTRQNTEVKTTEGGFSRTMIVLLQIGVRQSVEYLPCLRKPNCRRHILLAIYCQQGRKSVIAYYEKPNGS